MNELGFLFCALVYFFLSICLFWMWRSIWMDEKRRADQTGLQPRLISVTFGISAIGAIVLAHIHASWKHWSLVIGILAAIVTILGFWYRHARERLP